MNARWFALWHIKVYLSLNETQLSKMNTYLKYVLGCLKMWFKSNIWIETVAIFPWCRIIHYYFYHGKKTSLFGCFQKPRKPVVPALSDSSPSRRQQHEVSAGDVMLKKGRVEMKQCFHFRISFRGRSSHISKLPANIILWSFLHLPFIQRTWMMSPDIHV